MKGMKYLPVLVFSLIVLGICCSIYSSRSQDVDEKEKMKAMIRLNGNMVTGGGDEAEDTINELPIDSSWVSPPIPKFLAKYYGKAEVYADTICVVDEKAYYFGYDDHYRTAVIYTLDEVLCENPVLTYDSASSSSKTKFVVSTAFNSVTVDFADRKSIAQLKELMPEFGHVRRFNKFYHSDKGRASYSFEIDFPRKKNKFNDNIRKWLIWRVDDAYNDGVCITPENGLHSSFRKIKYNADRYEGNIRDVKALGGYVSDRLLDGMEQGNEDDSVCVPLSFCDLSLRLVSTNGKYFSYQKYTYEYYGGIHGYPTQEIISFDPESNEEIDWDYLFEDCNDEKILSLFYKVVQKDRHFQKWSYCRTWTDIKEVFGKDCGGVVWGNRILPTPGLTDKGVVFSFQPYFLCCYAAGCFHFTIPYKALKPYMTDRAKRLLNL